MSNPAVTELCRVRIAQMRFWMDDNIGESIHIHLNDVRVDLTNAEFERMFSDICIAVNEMIDVEGFDCLKMDTVFLTDVLWESLRHLKKVKIDNVPLKSLLCRFNGSYAKLPDVQLYMGNLQDKGKDCDSVNKEEDVQEIDNMLQLIEKRGYPFDGRYIILFEEENIIRDGQDYAVCLWQLLGDVSVPVKRLYFDNYADINKKSLYKHSKLYHKTYKRAGNLFSFGKSLQKIFCNLRNHFYKTRVYQKYYMKKHKTDHDEVQRIFMQGHQCE